MTMQERIQLAAVAALENLRAGATGERLEYIEYLLRNAEAQHPGVTARSRLARLDDNLPGA